MRSQSINRKSAIPVGMKLACQVPKEKEMKKLFPVLMLIVIMTATGCGTVGKHASNVADRTYDLVDPTNMDNFADGLLLEGKGAANTILAPASGFIMAFIAIELNSNISSLMIDKTEEKIVGYNSNVMKKLTPGNYLLVLPPRISDGESFVYDDDMGRMIRNYLAVGKYGIPVSNVKDAEYIVVTRVRESLSKFYGVNYSEVSFSIHDKLDIPVYAASVRLESKSDRNFWYHATRKAKPVKQLTVKGITHILANGLPEAHGEAEDEPGYFASLMSKKEKKEEKKN